MHIVLNKFFGVCGSANPFAAKALSQLRSKRDEMKMTLKLSYISLKLSELGKTFSMSKQTQLKNLVIHSKGNLGNLCRIFHNSKGTYRAVCLPLNIRRAPLDSFGSTSSQSLSQVNQAVCAHKYENHQNHNKKMLFISFILGIVSQLAFDKAEAEGSDSFFVSGVRAYEKGFYKVAQKDLSKALSVKHDKMLINKIFLILTYIQVDEIVLAIQLIDECILELDGIKKQMIVSLKQFCIENEKKSTKLLSGKTVEALSKALDIPMKFCSNPRELAMSLLESLDGFLKLIDSNKILNESIAPFFLDFSDEMSKSYAFIYALKGICQNLQGDDEQFAVDSLQSAYINIMSRWPVEAQGESLFDSGYCGYVSRLVSDGEIVRKINCMLRDKYPEEEFVVKSLRVSKQNTEMVMKTPIDKCKLVDNLEKIKEDVVCFIRNHLITSEMDQKVLSCLMMLLGASNSSPISISALFIALASGLKTTSPNLGTSALISMAREFHANNPIKIPEMSDIHLAFQSSNKLLDGSKTETKLISLEFEGIYIDSRIVMRIPAEHTFTKDRRSLVKELLRFYSMK